jgi:hypothetical protein
MDLSHPAIEWGIEQALQKDLHPPLSTSFYSGGQADVIVITDGTSSRLVLKTFDPKAAFNSAKALEAEFGGLEAFHRRLAREPDPSVGCPEPIAVNYELMSYLMTYVSGKRLEQVWPTDRGDLPDRIVRGLRLYHEATGGAFGDFHPGNARSSRTRLVLFDPTMTDPFFDEVAEAAGGIAPADVGYWIYWLGSRSLRRFVTDTVATIRLRSLTLQLLIEAARQFMPGSPTDFVNATEFATRKHSVRLGTWGGIKHDILSGFIGRYASSVCGEARRRLAA